MLPTKIPISQGKVIYHGKDARERILNGINTISNAVGVTLGPMGKTVIIESPYGEPKITKDGVSVAKSIDFNDKCMNIGAQLVKSVASQSNDYAGDGTTTATILVQSMCNEGLKALQSGLNHEGIKSGIEKAKNEVLKSIKEQSKKIENDSEIKNVAEISSNDKEIGKMISDAMKKIGKEGMITVREGKGINDTLEIISGMHLDSGLMSPIFKNSKGQKAIYNDCSVLITDMTISSAEQLVPILETIYKKKTPLLIIADNIEGDALTMLILNKIKGLPVVPIRAPEFGENRKQVLYDIAAVTGGEVISYDLGMKLENATEKQLGKVKRIEVDKENTVLCEGAGSKHEVDNRVKDLKENLSKAESDYEKKKLRERIAKMTGGIAVINVGGNSEVEVGEKKDRIDDAVCAVKAAVQEGIVPGGGVAFINASKKLDAMKLNSLEEKIGVDIVKNAILSPAKLIAKNAGKDGNVTIQKIKDSPNGYGFDAKRGIFCDMIKSGIIDPTKVVRTAFEGAISVSNAFSNSSAVVIDDPVIQPKSNDEPQYPIPGRF